LHYTTRIYTYRYICGEIFFSGIFRARNLWLKSVTRHLAFWQAIGSITSQHEHYRVSVIVKGCLAMRRIKVCHFFMTGSAKTIAIPIM